eukprot:1386651-Rhodomonas_salina.2
MPARAKASNISGSGMRDLSTGHRTATAHALSQYWASQIQSVGATCTVSLPGIAWPTRRRYAGSTDHPPCGRCKVGVIAGNVDLGARCCVGAGLGCEAYACSVSVAGRA